MLREVALQFVGILWIFPYLWACIMIHPQSHSLRLNSICYGRWLLQFVGILWIFPYLRACIMIHPQSHIVRLNLICYGRWLLQFVGILWIFPYLRCLHHDSNSWQRTNITHSLNNVVGSRLQQRRQEYTVLLERRMRCIRRELAATKSLSSGADSSSFSKNSKPCDVRYSCKQLRLPVWRCRVSGNRIDTRSKCGKDLLEQIAQITCEAVGWRLQEGVWEFAGSHTHKFSETGGRGEGNEAQSASHNGKGGKWYELRKNHVTMEGQTTFLVHFFACLSCVLICFVSPYSSCNQLQVMYGSSVGRFKVETPIHGIIRELVTWECKERGVKSWMC